MKHYKNDFFLLIIAILLVSGCKKTSKPNEGETITKKPGEELNYDYESINDENDGMQHIGSEIQIQPVTIIDNSARTKLIRRCESLWQQITRTKYVHYKDRIIDNIDKIYKYDCSGFIHAMILHDSLPTHALDLINWKKILHPEDYNVRVWSFYDYFYDHILGNTNAIGQNKLWKVFLSVDSLKMGDLIIARYDDEWREEWRKTGNSPATGHIMIAWNVGTPNSNNEVTIQVLDCAASGHTVSADTRYCNAIPIAEINEDSNEKSGIGFGMMKFKINNTHRRPYAFKWSINSTKWYNLRTGDEFNEGLKYDRIKGIIFARPI